MVCEFCKLTDSQKELVRQVCNGSNHLTYQQCIEYLDGVALTWR